MPEIAFGRYILQDLLGQGGMGQVYRARDTILDRSVAVKVLPPHAATDPMFRERFRREAHAAAALGEPHVIPIYDSGTIDDRLFIAMQLIDGTDLHTTLAHTGALTPERAVTIIDQAASALDAAHAVGLIHRDIKPANLLLTPKDFVYLIDFGIARVDEETGLTGTGATLGTLAYMAPERFDTGIADARCDTYALSCVLYECLTGAPPYPGTSLPQLLNAHLNTPPPQPSHTDRAIPPGFDDVIARGMAKHPDDRYPSAGAFADAARHALTTPTGPNTPVTVVNPAVAVHQPRPHESAIATAIRTPDPDAATGARPRRITRRRLVPAIIVAVIVVVAAGIGISHALTTGTTNAATNPTTDAATTSTAVNSSMRAVVPVGTYPEGVAVDPATHSVYVANDTGWSVSVIDTASRTVTGSIPVGAVGDYPRGVAVDPGNHTAYVTVAYSDSLSVIDTASRTVIATIPVGDDPQSVAVDPRSHTAYVTNRNGNSVSVVDTASRTLIGTLMVGSAPADVAIDPARNTVYVTNRNSGSVSVIDIASRTLVGTVMVGDTPDGVAVDPGAHIAYVANVKDNSVSVIDTATHTVTATIPVGNTPLGVAVDPGAHIAYVANVKDNSVSVIDTATHTVTATIPVGNAPQRIAVDPTTHTAYVTNYTGNSVSVLAH